MRTQHFLLIATACLAIAGCNQAGGPTNDNGDAANAAGPSNAADNAANASTDTAQAGGCTIEGSSDWLAEAHDTGGQKVAIVTGKVDVQSEGFSVSLTQGLLEPGPPPVQRVTLNAVPPSTPSAQKTTTEDVRISVPIAGINQKVAVDCGGKEIARVDVVRP